MSSNQPGGASLEGAKEILTALGFEPAQTNDRAGWVLLALLGLSPGDLWDDAINDMLGTLAIMDRIRRHWGKDYAANSRETIRRQTLHQFVDAGLVEYNADDPGRPVNSAHNNYRVSPRGLELVRSYDTDDFDEMLDQYLADLPGLRKSAAAQRDLARIPLTLPGGEAVSLSPGGQNTLIKAIVEELCPRFTPGGQVLYLGDADSKFATFDYDAFAKLGLYFDSHGKMPDVVIYLPQRNWLVLIEAASTHGPIDNKRHRELKELFTNSSAPIVFISCFPDRRTMRTYLPDLAWETEAWVADNPDHMIHFNGDRFLGPATSG